MIESEYSALSLLASYLGVALITVFMCPFIFKGISKEGALFYAFLWPFLIVYGALLAIGVVIKITFEFVFDLGKAFRILVKRVFNDK